LKVIKAIIIIYMCVYVYMCVYACIKDM